MRGNRSKRDGKKKLTSLSVSAETRRLVRELQNELSYSELGNWNGYWSADDVISAAVKAYRNSRSPEPIGSHGQKPIDNDTSADGDSDDDFPWQAENYPRPRKAIDNDSDGSDDQGAE